MFSIDFRSRFGTRASPLKGVPFDSLRRQARMGLLGKALGAVGDAAEHVVGAVQGNVLPPPPPKKVWCVTLRRKPTQTDEDKPEIGCCEKFWTKFFLFPFALVTYFIGWTINTIIWFLACVCFPCIGPQVCSMFVAARLEALQRGQPGAANAVKNDVENAMCCAKCMVKTYSNVYLYLICPLCDLCNW